ncbi:MAG: IS1634 family transposase [Desulfobacterales bacterium]
MYIEVVKNRNSPPCILLRESRRIHGRVEKKTLANLTNWPSDVVAGLKILIKRDKTSLIDDFKVQRALPHGHVAATLGTLKRIGLEKIIASKPSLNRDIVEALIIQRILNPGSKLAAKRSFDYETASSTLGKELAVENASEDDVYSALDWLLKRQVSIENTLAKKHLRDGILLFYDVSSSYFEGKTCPLARYGHNKDKKRGKLQIVYGLLCDIEGRPIAVEVFEGNTADPKTLNSQIQKIKSRFGLNKVVFVGDRGIVTEARISEELEHTDFKWISALRAPAIKDLIEKKVIQPELFDRRDLAEISSPEYPNDRLIVCRNPFLAEERDRTRNELLAETEKLLLAIKAATERAKRPLRGAARIGGRATKALEKFKMKKHFVVEITDESFDFRRNEEKIEQERTLDGFYIIRTNVTENELGAEKAVEAYKGLARVETAFRTLKTIDLHIRPIYHRLSDRVRAHVFLCFLAYYVVWHMKKALAPILFIDDDKESAREERDSIVSPAQRSAKAIRKTISKRTEEGFPVHSFRTLLNDLGTVSKVWIQPNVKGSFEIERITELTPLQQKAFDLLELSA